MPRRPKGTNGRVGTESLSELPVYSFFTESVSVSLQATCRLQKAHGMQGCGVRFSFVQAGAEQLCHK